MEKIKAMIFTPGFIWKQIGKDVYKWNYREGFGGKNTVWGGVEEVSNLIQLWII